MSEWNADTADWYASKYGEYATNRLAVEALELHPRAVIVDVGCGTGAALRHAATRVTEGALIGVDPIPGMIEIARGRVVGRPVETRIEFREGSAEVLPVDDNAADVVFAFDSFDHWQDRARGLAEIHRVLCNAGCLVVVKDGGVPGGDKERRAFLDELVRAGFVVLQEMVISADGVSFKMWVCTAED